MNIASLLDLKVLTNIMAASDVLFVIAMLYILSRLNKKYKEMQLSKMAPYFAAATVSYAAYKAVLGYAQLTQPRILPEWLLAASFFLFISGVSAFIGSTKALKRNREMLKWH